MHVKLKQLKLFEKSANIIDKEFAEAFSVLMKTASIHSEMLKELVDELVLKPKKLKARYPIPTFGVLEGMTYAEQFPNLYEAFAREQHEAGIIKLPPSEEKK